MIKAARWRISAGGIESDPTPRHRFPGERPRDERSKFQGVRVIVNARHVVDHSPAVGAKSRASRSLPDLIIGDHRQWGGVRTAWSARSCLVWAGLVRMGIMTSETMTDHAHTKIIS
jgi:hypothetical protein